MIRTVLSSVSGILLQPVLDGLDSDFVSICSIDLGLKQNEVEELGQLTVTPASHLITNSLFLLSGYILCST